MAIRVIDTPSLEKFSMSVVKMKLLDSPEKLLNTSPLGAISEGLSMRLRAKRVMAFNLRSASESLSLCSQVLNKRWNA